tara:strand:+ start:664 stop:834 length:171 start_codon:yes stop_codon:yes gene_type:complete
VKVIKMSWEDVLKKHPYKAKPNQPKTDEELRRQKINRKIKLIDEERGTEYEEVEEA